MRSNFRPNIRLAINILLVIGTFAIALKIAPIAVVYQEKNLCIKYLKHQIDRDELIKRLKIVKKQIHLVFVTLSLKVKNEDQVIYTLNCSLWYFISDNHYIA